MYLLDRSPYFSTWPFVPSLSTQVGMFEGLYRELLPMIDSVAASVEFMKVCAHYDRDGLSPPHPSPSSNLLAGWL